MILGFRVQGSGLGGFWGTEIWVSDFLFGVQNLGLKAMALKVWGLGLGAESSRSRAPAFGT